MGKRQIKFLGHIMRKSLGKTEPYRTKAKETVGRCKLPTQRAFREWMAEWVWEVVEGYDHPDCKAKQKIY